MGEALFVYKSRYSGLRYRRPVRNVTHLINTLQIQCSWPNGQGRSALLKAPGVRRACVEPTLRARHAWAGAQGSKSSPKNASRRVKLARPIQPRPISPSPPARCLEQLPDSIPSVTCLAGPCTPNIPRRRLPIFFLPLHDLKLGIVASFRPRNHASRRTFLHGWISWTKLSGSLPLPKLASTSVDSLRGHPEGGIARQSAASTSLLPDLTKTDWGVYRSHSS